MILDISEQVQAEQFMRSLFDHHPHGIVHVDLNGTILEVNDAVVAMSGYLRDELVGRHFLTFAAPRAGKLSAQLFAETTGGRSRTAEIEATRKDGSQRILSMTTIPVRTGQTIGGAFLVFEDITELKDTQERYRSLFAHNPDGVIALDREGRIVAVNDAVLALGTYSREQIIGQDFRIFINEHEYAVVEPQLRRVLAGHAVTYDLAFRTPGGIRALKVRSFPTFSGTEIVGFYAIVADATLERDAQSRAREQENRIRELYLLAINPTIADAMVTTMLQTGCRLLNVDVAAIVDCTNECRIEQHVDLRSAPDQLSEGALMTLANMVSVSRNRVTVTSCAPVADTYPYAVAVPLHVAGVFYGALCFASTSRADPQVEQTDVDLAALMSAILASALERQRSRANLRTLAYYDSLTGLPNRLFIQERLRDSLESAQMHMRRVALLFFDLDRFQDVNDTFGHAIGDRLLQRVAARLLEAVGDRGMVARMGGDEYAVLLPDCESLEEIRSAADSLLHAIDEPYSIDEYEQFITASAGISIYPDDGKDDQTLIKNADIAMYRAKDLGRNAYQFYAPSLEATIQMRLSQEKLLRRALENEEFVVHYQPQVDMLSGKIVALEALVRWNHPKTGIIFPGRFIPSAEISGLIVPLGDWVLRRATAQMQAWQPDFAGLRIAVNLSAKQFHQPDLRARILSALETAGLSSELLELEITEGVAMTDAASTISIMNELVEAGVGFGLDDFGTGYSSLAYLRRFPAEILKIDRSFVSGIGTEPNDETIVITVIAMAHNLGLEVVAEGVETAGQYDFLRTYGCDRVQGYYISPAVRPAQSPNSSRNGDRIRNENARSYDTRPRSRGLDRLVPAQPAAVGGDFCPRRSESVL
ncbi:MAG: EAL domain-containing protein [Candidatus Eremiobacteraeota bacterium]|nr:EAL domain-containing protein [Candidatus Eremiobacteraeota bacterium]